MEYWISSKRIGRGAVSCILITPIWLDCQTGTQYRFPHSKSWQVDPQQGGIAKVRLSRCTEIMLGKKTEMEA